MGHIDRQLTNELTQLRGDATEESLEHAAKLERDREKDLAKNASDEDLTARGYNPDDLRKAHRNTAAKRSGSSSSSSSSSSSKKKG